MWKCAARIIAICSLLFIINGGFQEIFSWRAIIFLIFYTALLVAAILYLVPERSIAAEKYGPVDINEFRRLKNYFTFLPITHLLNPSNTRNEIRKGNNGIHGSMLCNEGNELEERINYQRDILIETLLEEYILPWYTKISDEKSFPDQIRYLFQSIFDQMKTKIENIDRNMLAKDIIQALHCHWKEYCLATEKRKSMDQDLHINFTLTHPFLHDKEKVCKHYVHLTSILLKTLLVEELQAPLILTFFSGVLVKSFILYHINGICQPGWLNACITAILKSRNSSHFKNALQDISAPHTPTSTDSFRSGSDSVSSSRELGEKSCDEDFSTDSGDESSKGLEIDDNSDQIGSCKLITSLKEPRKHLQSKSISSALEKVLPSTTLPLLPLLEEEKRVRVVGLDEEKLSSSDTGNSPSAVSASSALNNHKKVDLGINIETIPTHYYSFEEQSCRKGTHALTTTTRSLDEIFENASKPKTQFNAHLSARNSSLSSEKPTRSPIYEEPEDFAASIAKLRSLLEQRENQKKPKRNELEEAISAFPETQMANYVVDDAVKNDLLECDNNETSLPHLSHLRVYDDERNEGCLEDSEFFGLATRRSGKASTMFFNVHIPKVETVSEDNRQLILYCIQYEGIYDDEDCAVAVRSLKRLKTTIKRSFKEFLFLHTQLQSNSLTKPYIKGIKSPNRWFNISFTRNPVSATEQRRKNLEKYLQQLCYHPVLGYCQQVLHFMAYGDEGFQFLGSQSAETDVFAQRIDNITKTFTGVISSLREAFPRFDSDISPLQTPQEHTPTDHNVPFDSLNEDADTEIEVTNKTEEWLDASSTATMVPPAEDSSDGQGNFKGDPEDLEGDFIPKEQMTWMTATYPLASAVTMLLCDVLWLPNTKPNSKSVSTFMSISGKSLENYVQETLEVFWSQDAALGYLEWMVRSFSSDKSIFGAVSYGVEDLKKCVRNRIPGWIRWMWGKNRLDLTIDRLTGFCQDEVVNHDLILSIVELLFSKIVGGTNCSDNDAQGE